MQKSRRITLKTIIGCLVSALLLGVSQPMHMPSLFLSVNDYQAFLGMLGWIGYVPLFLLIHHSKNLKHSFLLSFFTMTVQYTIVLYWIYIALHVHGHIPPLAASVITLLLPMLLALKGTLFITLGKFLSSRFNVSFLFFAPLALCAGEYFRNFYIFGGFPWGNVGYSVARIDQFLQIASLVGIYGIVFIVGVVNALIAFYFIKRNERTSFAYLAAAFSLALLCFVYGALRLYQSDDEFAPRLRVALLQGNIPQEIKNQARLHANEILEIYLGLHKKAKEQGAELVIWPEASYPRMLDENIKEIASLKDINTAAIIGASVYGEDDDEKNFHAHNAALFIDHNGRVVKRYDKSHLVPFGEYVPWPMSGMVDKIVPGLGAFLPGSEYVPEKLSLSLANNIAIGATVCYEGIFPEISRSYANHDARLLVNLTNDAWYGISSAPYQHLLMYQIRSAESGLPFVRATNSGVSAWVDAYGRMHQSLGLFERGVLIDDIPLIKKRTLYNAIGDIIPMLSLLVLIAGYIFCVLPVHQFIAMRQWGKLAIFIILLSIAIAAHVYYGSAQFLTDESARTKALIIGLLCLLLMIGFLTKTRRSRTILVVFAMLIVFCSIALAIFESPYFLLGLLFGLLIYLLAFRIKVVDQPDN